MISHKLFDNVLKKYVHQGNVDYVNLNNKDFEDYLKILKKADLHDVERLKSEKFSFWINAYNALAIKTVLDKVIPNHVNSIRKIPLVGKNIWDSSWYVVAGKKISLNTIEHKILRPLKDPRIHSAIVCASQSCPPLRSEAYTARKLNDQLDDQMKIFTREPYVEILGEKGFLIKKRFIKVSPIFKWFKEDFNVYGGIEKTIKHYSGDKIRKYMKKEVKLKFQIYDWRLNSK